jgi:hypothetical protein
MNDREKDLISFLKKRGGLAGYAEILKAGFDKTFIKNAIIQAVFKR